MKQLPILILPGTLCTGAMFVHQIKRLKTLTDNIEVVQFSNENTLAKMAAKVISTTHQQPCAIIGFSMGGIVALEVAKTRPELIGKLCMINSNCHSDLPERKAARHEQIAQAQNGQLQQLIQQTFMPNYLHQPNQQLEQLILDMALTLGADCFAAQAKAIEDRPDSLIAMQALSCDIQIIGGLEDKICQAPHQRMMYDALPNSQLALLSPCGHFAPLEQAEQVSDILVNWYKK